VALEASLGNETPVVVVLLEPMLRPLPFETVRGGVRVAM